MCWSDISDDLFSKSNILLKGLILQIWLRYNTWSWNAQTHWYLPCLSWYFRKKKQLLFTKFKRCHVTCTVYNLYSYILYSVFLYSILFVQCRNVQYTFCTATFCTVPICTANSDICTVYDLYSQSGKLYSQSRNLHSESGNLYSPEV